MGNKKKPEDKDIEKYIESLDDDYEPDGKFGNDPDHMALNKAPIKSKGNDDIRSIRIDDSFLNEIKETAQKEGFDSYQTFIKVILRRYIEQKKKASSE